VHVDPSLSVSLLVLWSGLGYENMIAGHSELPELSSLGFSFMFTGLTVSNSEEDGWFGLDRAPF